MPIVAASSSEPNLENASIIVPETWEANEILCNVTNIYEYDKFPWLKAEKSLKFL